MNNRERQQMIAAKRYCISALWLRMTFGEMIAEVRRLETVIKRSRTK